MNALELFEQAFYYVDKPITVVFHIHFRSGPDGLPLTDGTLQEKNWQSACNCKVEGSCQAAAAVKSEELLVYEGIKTISGRVYLVFSYPPDSGLTLSTDSLYLQHYVAVAPESVSLMSPLDPAPILVSLPGTQPSQHLALHA